MTDNLTSPRLPHSTTTVGSSSSLSVTNSLSSVSSDHSTTMDTTADSLPSQIFWLSGDHGPLRTILSYLSPVETLNVSLLCTATSTITKNERLWYNYWPWVNERPHLKSLLYVPTYKYAMQLQSLYSRPVIQATVLDYQDHLLQDVTCPLYIGDYRIYGYSNGLVRVFGPLHAGSSNREYELHSGSIRHMQLIPEYSKLYVGSWKGRVHSIDLITGTVKRIVTIEPERLGGEPVYGLRIISGDRLCTCSGDGIVRVYSIAEGTNIGVLEGHTGAITDLVAATVVQDESTLSINTRVSSSSSSTSSSSSNMAPFYSKDTSSSPKYLTNRTSSSTSKSSYIRLVSSSYDGTLRVWDLRNMSCVAVLEGHHGPIWSVAIIHNNIIFSSSADGTVRVWYIGDSTRKPSPNAYDDDDTSCSTNTKGGLPSNTTAPLLSSKCIHVLSPYAAILHRQIWCIKVIGNRIFMGCSDGAIHCYRIHIDMENILANEPVVSSHLWTYNTGINHSDGIRRMDVVKEYVYTCTKYGNVGIFKMISHNPSINVNVQRTSTSTPGTKTNGNSRGNGTNNNSSIPPESLSSTLSLTTPVRPVRNVNLTADSSPPMDEDTHVPPYSFLENILLHNNDTKISPNSSHSDIDDTGAKLNDSTDTSDSSVASSDSEYRYRNGSDEMVNLPMNYRRKKKKNGENSNTNDNNDENDDDYFPSLTSLVRTGTGPCSTYYKSNSVSPSDQEENILMIASSSSSSKTIPIVSSSSSSLSSSVNIPIERNTPVNSSSLVTPEGKTETSTVTDTLSPMGISCNLYPERK